MCVAALRHVLGLRRASWEVDGAASSGRRRSALLPWVFTKRVPRTWGEGGAFFVHAV